MNGQKRDYMVQVWDNHSTNIVEQEIFNVKTNAQDAKGLALKKANSFLKSYDKEYSSLFVTVSTDEGVLYLDSVGDEDSHAIDWFKPSAAII